MNDSHEVQVYYFNEVMNEMTHVSYDLESSVKLDSTSEDREIISTHGYNGMYHTEIDKDDSTRAWLMLGHLFVCRYGIPFIPDFEKPVVDTSWKEIDVTLADGTIAIMSQEPVEGSEFILSDMFGLRNQVEIYDGNQAQQSDNETRNQLMKELQEV